MSRYYVYANDAISSSHAGLLSACVDARTAAQLRPGVKFSVRLEGVKYAHYTMGARKLAVWMR